MAMAASTSSQFRSFIFFSAISRIWSRVTRAEPCRPCRGSCEPFSIFAAFLRKKRDRRRLHLEGEGPVLIGGDHHRDRRALFHLLRSCALNALQNSMMLMPR